MQTVIKDNIEVEPNLYSRDFYFTCNDGFEEFQKGYGLSYIKKKELSLLDIHPGHKFLDIGHGRGEILYHLEKLGAFVYGVDYSDEANSIAKEVLRQSPNAKILKADCENLPFKNNFFDRILISDLIEHLSFEKGIRLIKETYRILASGGMFLLHTSPNAWFMKIIYPLLINMVNKKKGNGIRQHVNIQNKVHVHEYSYFLLKKLARAAGIKAKIWVDNDLIRGGTFRHIKYPSRTVEAVKFFEKFCVFPIRIFLGNDLWMRFIKK